MAVTWPLVFGTGGGSSTPAEIEAGYNSQVPAASQAEMETGTEAAIRRVSPLRVAQAIAALGGSVPPAGTRILQPAGKIGSLGNIGGDASAVTLSYTGVDKLRGIVTSSFTGAFPLPTNFAVPADVAVGDYLDLYLELVQDGTGGRGITAAQFATPAGGIVGYFPMIGTPTPAGHVFEVIWRYEVTAIGPTTGTFTVYLGNEPKRATKTYTGTAKTWNSDSITDAEAFTRFTSTSAKTYTITAGDGMRADDMASFKNAGATGDLTVVQGSGMTLSNGTGLVFAPGSSGCIRFSSATAADVIGGTT